MDSFNTICPYCEHAVTITSTGYTDGNVYSNIDSVDGTLGVSVEFVVCPNEAWQRTTLGRARAFPDYVPAAVRTDYEEACAIQDLSPKAAATLARRAVQGVVRGYWGINKYSLKDELDALEKLVGQTVDPQTWKSLDAVRELGNIGAHPERDISLIVDVESGEAELLIKVVETLIDDTYIARKKREDHFAAVEQLRAKKNAERGKPP
jgi:hypothetical protein